MKSQWSFIIPVLLTCEKNFWFLSQFFYTYSIGCFVPFVSSLRPFEKLSMMKLGLEFISHSIFNQLPCMMPYYTLHQLLYWIETCLQICWGWKQAKVNIETKYFWVLFEKKTTFHIKYFKLNSPLLFYFDLHVILLIYHPEEREVRKNILIFIQQI